MSNKNSNFVPFFLTSTYEFLSEYGTQVCWSVSFVANRFISRAPDESYKDSGVSAIIIGTIAATDITLRYGKYVSTYAVTYGALTASYAFPIINNMIISSNTHTTGIYGVDHLYSCAAKFISLPLAILSGLGAGVVVNQGYSTETIVPVITTAINYKTYGLKAALPASIISIFDEVLINYNITNSHYLSVAAISASTIGSFIPNSYFVIPCSVVISAVIATKENEFLEMFLPIKSTKQTYNILSKISNDNTDEIDMKLETLLVTTANTEFTSAILNIQSFIMFDKWIILLGEVYKDKANFARVLSLTKNSILFDIAKIISVNLFKDTINSFSLVSTVKSFQEKFYINKVLKQNNFILLSKSDYTSETYSNDISSIMHTHLNIYHNIVSSLPHMITFTSLGNKILLIPAVALVDLAYTYLLSYIDIIIQTLDKEQLATSVTIGQIERHDLENANFLVQADALDYKANQWQNFTDTTNMANSHKMVLVNIRNSLLNFNWQVINLKGISLGILFLQYKDIIPADGLLQLFFAIKGSVDLVLIKSKSKLALDNTNSSIERLENFFEKLKNQKQDLCSVKILPEDENQILNIQDLTYIRGNEESNITITIPSLSFNFGKRYVITGENGIVIRVELPFDMCYY
jgi:hypothetical protein